MSALRGKLNGAGGGMAAAQRTCCCPFLAVALISCTIAGSGKKAPDAMSFDEREFYFWHQLRQCILFLRSVLLRTFVHCAYVLHKYTAYQHGTLVMAPPPSGRKEVDKTIRSSRRSRQIAAWARTPGHAWARTPRTKSRPPPPDNSGIIVVALSLSLSLESRNESLPLLRCLLFLHTRKMLTLDLPSLCCSFFLTSDTSVWRPENKDGRKFP